MENNTMPGDEYLSEEEIIRLTEKERKKKKAVRRLLYIVFVITASLLLSLVVFPKMVRQLNDGLLVQSVISQPDISNKPDGVYSGSCTTYGYSCTAEVTVVAGTIINIDITASSGLDAQRAEAVASAIAAYNSFDLYSLSYNDIPIGTEPTDIVVFSAVHSALTEGISV